MTTDEIKQQYSMPDVLARYGIKVNRNNMCSCPFHGQDKHPSAKVFKDGLNCFTCGWNGDVFKFVQDIENCDFKTAFKILGGSYKKHETKASKILSDRKYRLIRQEKEKKEKQLKELKNELDFCLKILNAVIKIYDPEDIENVSDEYTDALNDYPIVFYMWEQIYEGKEVNIEDVIRKCKHVRHKYYSI